MGERSLETFVILCLSPHCLFNTEVFHPHAEKIRLVCDNLNTHTLGALYERFEPGLARSLARRLEFVYTPKHGSWLNIAENELSALTVQCVKDVVLER